MLVCTGTHSKALIPIGKFGRVKFKIPDRDTVSDSVREVMRHNQRVESQRELSDLVQKELETVDPDYRISGERIRKIAVSSEAVRLEIEYRETDRDDLPDICPVCGNSMTPIINMTLEGDRTEVKRTCSVCPFSIGRKPRIPGRYIFFRTSLHEVSDMEDRIRKLKKAASHLRAAEKLISEALEGTDFPDRKEFAAGKIHEILKSREDAGSLPNLEADIRDSEREGPLWTEPLNTPKYPSRK